MTRLAVLGLAALCPLAAGCANDGQMSLRRALGWDEQKVHELPRGLNLTTHLEYSARVEELGHRIIAQNTFTGIEPMFLTVGAPESVLFHRGAEELVISDGLVKQCKTDAELAAVLCSELGQMVAEKKAVRRVGADRDSFPNNGLPAGSTIAGGAFDDPGRAAEMAYRDRNRTRTTPTIEPADASKLSRDLLKGAGFDTAELDRVEPLLKQSDRGAALKKQLGGSAPPPKWDN
jgi:hypothetical protein